MKKISNGNDFKTLFRKLYFTCLPTQEQRSRYIKKHSNLFRHIGEKVVWQPRSFPYQPQYISIGDNVKIASNVSFVNHDIIGWMLKDKYGTGEFIDNVGCIEIGDNVIIGAGTRILPNVKIGSNVIIGAGAVVTKDAPQNSVWGGVPAHRIGDFDELVDKRKNLKTKAGMSIDDIWKAFYDGRENNGD